MLILWVDGKRLFASLMNGGDLLAWWMAAIRLADKWELRASLIRMFWYRWTIHEHWGRAFEHLRYNVMQSTPSLRIVGHEPVIGEGDWRHNIGGTQEGRLEYIAMRRAQGQLEEWWECSVAWRGDFCLQVSMCVCDWGVWVLVLFLSLQTTKGMSGWGTGMLMSSQCFHVTMGVSDWSAEFPFAFDNMCVSGWVF